MQLTSCINGLLTAATAPGLCDHRETGAEGRPGRFRAGAGDGGVCLCFGVRFA